MKPSLLFIINSDPRLSHRPAEAIRVAAGIGVWKKVDVTVCLCESAVLVLSEFVDGLVDEDNFIRYLPIMGGLGNPLYVETGAPLLEKIGQATLPFERIT